MILFENFTYNQQWAEENYKPTIKDSYWYLESLVNHDQEFLNTLSDDDKERFCFNMHKMNLKMETLDNVYEVSVFSHPSWLMKEDQKQFVKRKLSEKLGDAVDFRIDYVIKTIVPEEASHRMYFQYFIEKDELRNDINHRRVDLENSIMDKFYNMCVEPDIETWLEMLELQHNKKSERIVFKNIDTFEEFSKKMVIAVKLKWWVAANVINQRIYHFICKEEKDTHYNYVEFAQAGVRRFANDYEVPEDIQEIIDAYEVNSKCKGQAPTPKSKKFAAELDNNLKVASYNFTIPKNRGTYDPLFIINVTLTNGNEGWIAVRHYLGLYRMGLYLNNNVEDPINRVGDMIFSARLETSTRERGVLERINDLIDDLYKLKIKED